MGGGPLTHLAHVIHRSEGGGRALEGLHDDSCHVLRTDTRLIQTAQEIVERRIGSAVAIGEGNLHETAV